MRALLLAAGQGTRLRPLTERVPKCLVEICGKPLLDFWLEALFASPKIDRVLINTHWLADQVIAHVDRCPWRDRIDITQETELLGTGGTIRANADYFGDTTFFVAHADNLTEFDLAHFIAQHETRPTGVALSMLSFQTDDPRSCGILELDGRHVVQQFHEKVENPPGNLANAAVYLFEPEIRDFIVALDKDFIDLSLEVMPHYLGRILSVETRSYHRDIGTPASLAQAEKDFAARLGR